jgi:sulfite reductase (ferredoxin)
MEGYELGSWKSLPDPFAPPSVKTDANVGIDSALLATLGEEASARGYDAATLLDMIVREALEG